MTEETRAPGPASIGAHRAYRLSRYVQLHPERSGFTVESLITGRVEHLPNATAVRLLLSFSSPITVEELSTQLGPDRSPPVLSFLDRCLAAGLITAVDKDGGAEEDKITSLTHWERHDLAFHLRSRRGRNPNPVGATWRLASLVPPEPVRRSSHSEIIARIQLPSVDIARLRQDDWPLTRALEERRSRYSTATVPLEALAGLLFRACRVTGSGDGYTSGELVTKVHPSGGSLHSLETYVIVERCTGLDRGGYRYDPFDHQLELIRRTDAGVTALLRDAQAATQRLRDTPSVLLIFASRFRRVTRKYQSLAYHVILQEVGALYQTVYLVAQTMNLAVSAIGSGDSERFANVFGTDFFAESSVGEMIVGGLDEA